MTYNKYGAKKTVVDNITFASKKEADRYCQLKLLEKAGEIRNLELQPRYDLAVKGVKLGFYKADFRYEETWPLTVILKHNHTRKLEAWKLVIEDCKGFKTPIYRLKKKLLLALHGIDIYET